MEQLHLIVHKSMIEDELLSKLTPESKKPKLRRFSMFKPQFKSFSKHCSNNSNV